MIKLFILLLLEYNAGSILYLVESSNDESSSSSLILRGSASGQYIGTCCVAILPSNGPVPFSNSGMDEELILTEERKEGREENNEQVHHTINVKGKRMEEEKSENLSLESRETFPECYHTVDEKEMHVQQQDELMVTHLSITNHEGGIVVPQNPSPIPNQDITQLSSSNLTPSYSPSAPISVTDTKLVYPSPPSLTLQQNYFSQPSIPPHKLITRDFPETIERKDHGALLYAKVGLLITQNYYYYYIFYYYKLQGFVKELVSGNFPDLPKCEDLAQAQYDRLGKGGNGEVIQYLIGQHKVALKYCVYVSKSNVELK